MTTPDTEEATLKKGGDEAETLVWYVQHAQTTQDAVDHVRLVLTYRDTYWKERVRGMKWETNHVPFATEEQIRKCTCSACKHNQTLDTLLDNLK